MSKFSRIVFGIILVFAVATACEAPAGSEGPQGPQGEAGPIGPAGEDGSMMYAGPDAPTVDVGNEGDYYLNTTTGEYYGPKDDDGWGNPIIVLMGESGEDGSVIHSGDGPPSTDIGALGDYYFDQSSGDFYGPKTENGWGSPTNLTGNDGQDGADGADGSVIHAGVGAPEADLGKIGDFYFDESTGNFYGPKTENGWGSTTNLMGEDGQDGQDGEDGADGQDGSQILSGDGPPSILIGKTGDFYLDKTNFDLYGPKSAPLVDNVFGSWGTPINIKGAEGNANVTRYIFSGHDFSAFPTRIPTIPNFNDLPEESAWVVYLKKNNWMYHMPGWGSNGNSQYSVSHVRDSSLNFMFYITLQSGSGEVYDNIYVVRIESSETTDMSKQKPQNIFPDDLDTSDYQAVAEYYGFYK